MAIINDRTSYYMAGSIAESTAKSYDRAFKYWSDYASTNGLPLLPVNPIDLGNCLSSMADSTGSFSSISTLVASIARYHWDRFLPSPTENFAFRRLLQGFRRRLSKPPKPKDPLTPEIMASAIQMIRSSHRLQEWRTVARMCLAFYAGCRWSDASSLRVSNLKFDTEGVSVTIPKSKTDQLGLGETVYVQYAEHSSCPVTLLQDYITKLRYGDRDGYLQPRIRSQGGTQSGIWNTTVSYSTALSDLKILLASLGLDPSKFGEHSGRRGGATAASDAGVSWPDLMTHGRWKSMATPLGYLANTQRRQRKVASALAQCSVSSSDSSPGNTNPVARRITLSSSSDSSPVLPTSTPIPIPIPAPVSSPPVRHFAFQPLSNHDWIQAKKRYTGSSPPPQPPIRYSSELLASLLELSPPVPGVANASPTVSVASSAMDALFEDSDTFELMII